MVRAAGRGRYLIHRMELKAMILKRVILFLVVCFLFFGMAGGVAMVAAAGNGLNPGAGTDPDFFSPNWKPNWPTSSYSDPDFNLPSWKPKWPVGSYSDLDLTSPDWKPNWPTSSYSDPNFFSSTWKVPTYASFSDPDFMNSNWSVQSPVLFRFSLIAPSRAGNYDLDPFATDEELRAQGFIFSGGFW